MTPRGSADLPQTDWTPVFQALDIAQAQIVAAHLDDAGISVSIREEGASRAFPVDFGLLASIDILVPDDQVDMAMRVLIDLGLVDEDDDAPS